MSSIGPVTGQSPTPVPTQGTVKPHAGGAVAPPPVESAPPAQRPDVPPSNETRHLVEDLNLSLQSVTGLQFRLDQDLHKLVVTVVEKGSDKVIRQIPTEEMLELAKRIQDLEGVLFDKNA